MISTLRLTSEATDLIDIDSEDLVTYNHDQQNHTGELDG